MSKTLERDTRLFSLPGRQTNASPLAGLSTVNSFASILETQSEQGEVVWRATKDAGEDEWVQNLGRRTDLFSLHSNICEAELLSGCFYFSPFYDLLSSVFNSTLHYPIVLRVLLQLLLDLSLVQLQCGWLVTAGFPHRTRTSEKEMLCPSLNKHCCSDLERIAQLRSASVELLRVSCWINVRPDAAENRKHAQSKSSR